MQTCRPIIFTDIDDTLLQSRRKCPPDTPLYDGGYDSQGELISLYSEQQKTLLHWFSDGRIIPVTGRNTAALHRLTVQFQHEKIVNHGALILDEHYDVIPTWRAKIASAIEVWQDFLVDINIRVNAAITQQNLSLRSRVVEDHDVPCYVSIKGDPSQFSQLQSLLDEHKAYQQGAIIHLNGRNMALLPCYASKANAVAFLMNDYKKTYPHSLFIGAGDSHSDLPFMQLCHYMMIPHQSQINQRQIWESA